MKQVWSAIVAACVATALAGPASAQIKENAEMWDKVRVGNKLCMSDHEHYGESPAWVSERGAKAYAIRAWETFTAWEYGKAWGSYRMAAGRSLKCSRSGGRWICRTTARPCRRR